MSTTRPSLTRLMKIHQAIADKTNPTASRLAQLCGVTARTIKRDLRLLREEFGAPLQAKRGQGYWYAREFSLSGLPLTEGELLALCMMTSLTDTLQIGKSMPSIQRFMKERRRDILKLCNRPLPLSLMVTWHPRIPRCFTSQTANRRQRFQRRTW